VSRQLSTSAASTAPNDMASQWYTAGCNHISFIQPLNFIPDQITGKTTRSNQKEKTPLSNLRSYFAFSLPHMVVINIAITF
jgi:hypothetical protein